MPTNSAGFGRWIILGIGILVISGCILGNDKVAGSRIVQVKIVGSGQNGVPNATVVLGDSNGAMIASGTTDAKGEYTFSNAPGNATITAANSCIYTDVYSGYTYTTSSMSIDYDVNVPAVILFLDDCTPPLGTVNFKITNLPAGTVETKIMFGNSSYYTAAINNNQAQLTTTIYPEDLQSDGKLTVVAAALDSDDKPLSYGVLTDQSIISNMTLTIAANQPFTSFVQYHLTNIPTGATSVAADVEMLRNLESLSLSGSANDLLTGATSTTFDVPYIPGIADMYGYSAFTYFGSGIYGFPYSGTGIFNYSGAASAPSDQTFDFIQALAVPSNLAISYPTGTATPVMSWNGTNSADFIGGYMYYTNATSQYPYAFVSFLASTTRTTIPFPQLPDSLALLRPAGAGIQMLEIYHEDTSLTTGYDEFLSFQQQAFSTAVQPPENYTFKWSFASYWTPQGLAGAPGKSKTAPLSQRKRLVPKSLRSTF